MGAPAFGAFSEEHRKRQPLLGGAPPAVDVAAACGAAFQDGPSCLARLLQEQKRQMPDQKPFSDLTTTHVYNKTHQCRVRMLTCCSAGLEPRPAPQKQQGARVHLGDTCTMNE